MLPASSGRRRSDATTSRAACCMVALRANVSPGARAWMSTVSLGQAIVRVGLLEGAFRLPGLAGVIAGLVPAAHQLADGENGRDHQEPPEDGGLPVPDAPPGNPLDRGSTGPPSAAILVTRIDFRQY